MTEEPQVNSDELVIVFQDAQIFDIDLSKWSRHIRLYVVGIDAIFPLPRELPLYIVEFSKVEKFSCVFRHLEISLSEEDGYFQWTVSGCEITRRDQRVDIELLGSGNSPTMLLTCQGVTVRRIPNEMVRQVFPGWSKPRRPFARPGIEELWQARAAKGPIRNGKWWKFWE